MTVNQAMMHKTEEKLKHKEPSLGAQVETVSRDVKKLGRMAGESARRKLIETRDHGEQVCDQVRTKTRRIVERRPWAALAAAAGVGVLAGALLARK